MDGTEEPSRDHERPRPTGGARRRKPRIVLGLLVAGSLAGVWVSGGGSGPLDVLVRWGIVAGAGLLCGGLHWRLRLFDGEAFAPGDREAVLARWRRVERVGVGVLAVAALLALAAGTLGAGAGAWAITVGALVALGALAGRRADRSGTMWSRLTLFGAAAGCLAAFAWVETAGPVAWLVRVVHVGAFGLWLGGAAWHNAVVLPSVRASPSLASALRAQPRRFRRHLLAVVPALLLTGLSQAVGLFGTDVAAALSSPLGHAVVFKLLALAVLTAFVAAGLVRGRRER